MVDSSWHKQEAFKSLTTLSVEALKFISLVNGGAAVALVAYGFGKVPSHSLAEPMSYFVAGVVLCAFAYIAAYLTQLALYGESAGLDSPMPRHGYFLWAAGLLTVAATLVFALGCWKVVQILAG